MVAVWLDSAVSLFLSMIYALPCHVTMRYCEMSYVHHSSGVTYAWESSNNYNPPVLSMDLTDRMVSSITGATTAGILIVPNFVAGRSGPACLSGVLVLVSVSVFADFGNLCIRDVGLGKCVGWAAL